MKALLGTKIGMTQVFGEDGLVTPATVIEAGPCVVTQIKTPETDGYAAVQIGYGDIDKSRLTKPQLGHLKKARTVKRFLAEVPMPPIGQLKVGQELKADLFEVGEHADVIAMSKGKGFAGVMKRWGFGGGPGSHGAHFHRAPGSIGAAATPSRVFKGSGMPGQVGNERVTAQNLEILKVEPEHNLLLVKGSVPGANGSVVLIRSSKKAG